MYYSPEDLPKEFLVKYLSHNGKRWSYSEPTWHAGCVDEFSTGACYCRLDGSYAGSNPVWRWKQSKEAEAILAK